MVVFELIMYCYDGHLFILKRGSCSEMRPIAYRNTIRRTRITMTNDIAQRTPHRFPSPVIIRIYYLYCPCQNRNVKREAEC